MLKDISFPIKPRCLLGEVADILHSGAMLEVRPAGSGKAGASFAFVKHVQGQVPQCLIGQPVRLVDFARDGFSFASRWRRQPRTFVAHSANGSARVHVFQGMPTAKPATSQGVVFQFLPKGIS